MLFIALLSLPALSSDLFAAPCSGNYECGVEALTQKQYRIAESRLEAFRKETAKPSAQALFYLGLSQMMLGDVKRASRNLRTTLSLAQSAGDVKLIFQSNFNLGLLALAAAEGGESLPGERVAARSLFFANPAQDAADFFKAADTSAQNANDRVNATLGRVRALAFAKSFRAAADALASLETLATTGAHRLAAADAARRILSDFPEAPDRPWLKQFASRLVARELQSDDPRDRSLAMGLVAELYQAAGDGAAALAQARKALASSELGGFEDLRFRWLAIIGTLQMEAGDAQSRAAALVSFESARDSIARIRNGLPSFDPISGRSLFRESVGPVYSALAELYVERGASAPAADRNPLLEKARQSIEVLKQVEAEQFFQDDCVAAALGRKVEIDALEKEDPRTAIVYPIFLPRPEKDLLILLVTRGDAMRAVQVRLAKGAGSLPQRVARFRAALLDKDSDFFALRDTDGAALYDALIRPIAAEIAGADTIVFVPDGFLRLLPLGALWDRTQRKYLVETYATASVLGLELTSPKPLRQIPLKILTAGVAQPVAPVEDRSFSPLKFVPRELTVIQSRFGKNASSIGPAFTRATLKAALESDRYTVVHLATHASFGGAPRDNFLVTADPAGSNVITIEELGNIIKPTRLDGQPIELLTLSACETAIGDGRETMGLAGAALQAGARSVVASLWSIRDDATLTFFEAFYAELATGASKAKALQSAHLALLKGERRNFKEPHYWAPFTLIGNWQ